MHECYVNSTSDGYPSAVSFLDDNADLSCDCQLRNDAQMQADFAHYTSLTNPTEQA